MLAKFRQLQIRIERIAQRALCRFFGCDVAYFPGCIHCGAFGSRIIRKRGA
jgi:hypothetical protein